MLPGKRNSNSHGARPVHQIISITKWSGTSRSSVTNSLWQRPGEERGGSIAPSPCPAPGAYSPCLEPFAPRRDAPTIRSYPHSSNATISLAKSAPPLPSCTDSRYPRSAERARNLLYPPGEGEVAPRRVIDVRTSGYEPRVGIPREDSPRPRGAPFDHHRLTRGVPFDHYRSNKAGPFDHWRTVQGYRSP